MSKKTAKKDSRKITESLPQSLSKWQVFGHEFQLFTLVFLALCLAFFTASLIGLVLNYEAEQDRRLAAQDNYSYWQEVAAIQKNSPDAYYQAGIYAAELGKNQEAYGLLQRAIDLDPEFSKARDLQERITNQ
jgi:tetratricopeptide (TPR) repeat protein